MSLAEQLKTSVNEKYKLRVLELAKVLDPKVNYNIVTVSKVLDFKSEVQKATAHTYQGSSMSYDMMVLNGVFSLYPELRMFGELIIVLFVKKEIIRETREQMETHTIIIFEHQASVTLSKFMLK